MKFRFLLCVALLCARGEAAAAQSPDSTLISAERAARAWLAQLDRAQYDSAYTHVAAAMRAEVAGEQWAASMRSLRSVLPPNPERVRVRAEHGVRLFGGPSVLLTFRVHTTTWREIVVLVRDRERWRIGGYGVLM